MSPVINAQNGAFALCADIQARKRGKELNADESNRDAGRFMGRVSGRAVPLHAAAAQTEIIDLVIIALSAQTQDVAWRIWEGFHSHLSYRFTAIGRSGRGAGIRRLANKPELRTRTG